jgi:hypothetical protein
MLITVQQNTNPQNTTTNPGMGPVPGRRVL